MFFIKILNQENISFRYLDTEGVLPPNSPTTVCTVGEPPLLPADHVEPVGEVPVLAGHLAGSVRVCRGGAQLHSYPREFADLEVVTSLRGELEGSDELVAGGGPVLTQSDGGVNPLTHPGHAPPGHHLEPSGGNKTRETATTHCLPPSPA